MDKKYLFICGCPRSGTTAMRWLLTRDKQILVSSERFIHKLWGKNSLTPDLFEKRRFFKQEEGDTFYNFESTRDYAELASRFDEAIYIGDKIPKLYQRFDTLEKHFPGATVVLILRNVFDVAVSYKKRHEDESDSSWTGGGIEHAVSDWNKMLEIIRDMNVNLNIAMISYENFFVKAQGISELLEFIGMQDSIDIINAYKSVTMSASALEARRVRNITSTEIEYICENANFDTYRSITKKKAGSDKFKLV